MGVKRHRSSALQPEWLPVHREPQHLQRRLERSIWGFPLLPNDTIAGWDVLTSCRNIPSPGRCATPARFVDDLQIEDDSASLDFPGFHPTVKDADGFREGRNVHAGREATRVGEGGRHGVCARQRAPGHPVAAVNVFLQFVCGRKGVKFRGRCDSRAGGRW